MERWYADGENAANESDAWTSAEEYVEVRLLNDAGEMVYTRWDITTDEVVRGQV